MQDALRLEQQYNSTTSQLDRKYDETTRLKQRADDLRQRAKILYEDYFYKQESLKGACVRSSCLASFDPALRLKDLACHD